VSGAECFGGISNDRICGTIIGALCDGDDKNALFAANLGSGGQRPAAARLHP